MRTIATRMRWQYAADSVTTTARRRTADSAAPRTRRRGPARRWPGPGPPTRAAYWSPPESDERRDHRRRHRRGDRETSHSSCRRASPRDAPPRADEHEHRCDQAQTRAGRSRRRRTSRPDRRVAATANGLTKSSSGGSRCLERRRAATWKADAGRRRSAPATSASETTFPAPGRGELQHQGEEHEPPDEAGVAQHGEQLGARQPVGRRRHRRWTGRRTRPSSALQARAAAEPEESPARLPARTSGR